MRQPICDGCKHRQSLPGDCHIRCTKPAGTPDPERLKPWPGCGYYPWCFDACIIESCKARKEREVQS